MMFIQLKSWKQLITNQFPLSHYHVSNVMSLPPPLAIYAKPHLRFPNFCTETAVPSTIPPDRGVVTEFLLNKCSLTEQEITKAFKHSNYCLRLKSVQNCKEVLELLNGCGLTTPAQIRKVVLRNPKFFFYRSERNIKPKLSFLRTFMKEEDIAKLIYTDARFIKFSEDRLKSAVSLLQELGLDGEAISELLAKQPRLLTALEKNVMYSFKEVENLGIKKGSKMFGCALRALLGIGKEKIDRRRLCFSRLGFSEKQISDFLRHQPMVLGLSEEKVKRKVDFLVNSVGFLLDDLAKNPSLFTRSLEKSIIPRFRVMEALKSMQLLKTKMSTAVSRPRFCWIFTMVGKLIIDKEKRSECVSVKTDSEKLTPCERELSHKNTHKKSYEKCLFIGQFRYDSMMRRCLHLMPIATILGKVVGVLNMMCYNAVMEKRMVTSKVFDTKTL